MMNCSSKGGFKEAAIDNSYNASYFLFIFSIKKKAYCILSAESIGNF